MCQNPAYCWLRQFNASQYAKAILMRHRRPCLQASLCQGRIHAQTSLLRIVSTSYITFQTSTLVDKIYATANRSSSSVAKLLYSFNLSSFRCENFVVFCLQPRNFYMESDQNKYNFSHSVNSPVSTKFKNDSVCPNQTLCQEVGEPGSSFYQFKGDRLLTPPQLFCESIINNTTQNFRVMLDRMRMFI